MQPVDVKSAILKALEEEKAPKSKRTFKVLVVSIGFFLILRLGLGRILFVETPTAWVGAALLWTIFWGLGYWAQSKPQPRIQVRGFWSSFALSRLLIATIVVTILHLFICPHFAFIETRFQDLIPAFSQLTDFYMSWGGHDFCMFMCGITLGALAALISFLGIWKTLSLRDVKGLLLASLAIPLSFLPLCVLQIQAGHLHSMTLYWILGALLAGMSIALLLGYARDRTAQ